MLRRRERTLLVMGLGAMRLGELAWSARNQRRAGPGRVAAQGSYPLMVGVNVALFATCLWRGAAGIRPPRPGAAGAAARGQAPPAVGGAALAAVAAAAMLRLWVIRSLGTAWNVRALVPERLLVVRRGPYRWVRHPNYVAVAVEFACLPLAVGTYADAALLSAANALVLVPRIRDEERLLDAAPGYREAFAGVPRFLPRRRAAPPPSPGG